VGILAIGCLACGIDLEGQSVFDGFSGEINT
jgi:hypothetical protein